MRWKAVLGIVLIIASLFAMYLWETKFRDEIFFETICVAARDIEEGEIISEAEIKTVKINPECLLNSAIRPDELSEILGKVCTNKIFENEQIVRDRFISESELDKENRKLMIVPKSWVFSAKPDMVSGNVIDIYRMPEKEFCGEFKLHNIFEDSYEIECSLDEYFNLYDRVPLFENGQNNKVFLFVLKGN